MTPSNRLIDTIKQDAFSLGFNAIGFCDAEQTGQTQKHYQDFIDAGFHGSMTWLEDTFARRADPKTLWPEAQTVIMLGMNYGPETDPLDALEEKKNGVISVYARHRDYHDVVKGRLKTLASKLVAGAKRDALDCDVKVFVDTAPVMEKPLAQSAGLGWQGKHTNLVSKDHGSWLFLGSIFTTLKIDAESAEQDYCGSCSNCLDVCPTNAFPAPYRLDARRCISYLTIENKGSIPVEFRKAMGNRIYGCDDCLAVCPWNKFASTAQETKLAAPKEQVTHQLSDFLALDDQSFRHRFSGSPVKRIGRNRFIRNCLIAAGNSQDASLIDLVTNHSKDDDPVIAESADWALDQLQYTTG